tara:strand:+ start:259 stop:1077 length:819 start_codon:yes stop_codon:yes gene_type:complete
VIRLTTPFVAPQELPKAEFYIHIDDGRDDLKWEAPENSAYYAIDTHLGYDFRKEKAKQFKYVYCAQKEGAARMRDDGVPQALWLPLACNHMAHPNYSEMANHPGKDSILGSWTLEKEWDVGFVGFLGRSKEEDQNCRVEWLNHLFGRFCNSWFASNCFFENMAVRYIRSRVGYNISIKNDLNMRFFEVMSSGTCLLTNTTVDGIEDLGFEEGVDFLGYATKDEMIDKAQWALDNPMEREAIAKSGHEKCRKFHTYELRMKKIIENAGIKLAA